MEVREGGNAEKGCPYKTGYPHYKRKRISLFMFSSAS